MGCGASKSNDAIAHISRQNGSRRSFAPPKNTFLAPLGAIKLRLEYDSSRQQLLLRVKEGMNLLVCDVGGSSDPFIVATMQPSGEKQQTKVINHNINPIWDQQLCWTAEGPFSADTKIVLDCWDKDKLRHDDYMGGCTIPVASLLACSQDTHNPSTWVQLFPKADSHEWNDLGANWTPWMNDEFVHTSETQKLTHLRACLHFCLCHIVKYKLALVFTHPCLLFSMKLWGRPRAPGG